MRNGIKLMATHARKTQTSYLIHREIASFWHSSSLKWNHYMLFDILLLSASSTHFKSLIEKCFVRFVTDHFHMARQFKCCHRNAIQLFEDLI